MHIKKPRSVEEDRVIHVAQNMIAIAKMILGKKLTVPVGCMEFKREEFLEAYEKRFSKSYERRTHLLRCDQFTCHCCLLILQQFQINA